MEKRFRLVQGRGGEGAGHEWAMGKRRTRTDRGDANGGPSVSPTRDDAQEKKRRTRTQKETSQDYAAKVQSAREPEDTFATHLAERDTPDVTADETRRRDENGKLVRFRMHCDGEEVRVLSNRNDMNSTLGCRVPADLEAYSVKERLRRHWGTLHRNKTGGREGEDMENEGHEVMEGSGIATSRFVSARQACLFSALHRYADVCLLGREMPDSSQRSPKDPSLDALLLHVVNHVMKTSDLVKRGNEAAKASKAGDGAEDAEPQRDQGFTRGKVLVLLPLRKFAFHFVRRLMRLVMLPNFGHKHFKSVPGGAQFLDEYGDGEEEELGAPSSKHMQGKPKDFRDTFSGNTDDHFRLGVKLTKSSVKLYSDFYKSDIIVASPLGLVTLINDAERTQEKAFEFLSSIEVLCVDHADVLMMQVRIGIVTGHSFHNFPPQADASLPPSLPVCLSLSELGARPDHLQARLPCPCGVPRRGRDADKGVVPRGPLKVVPPDGRVLLLRHCGPQQLLCGRKKL